MNRAGGKDTLITYERALEAQAELRKFRGSTIERKQMSTKTTFKRVALVAVAALGFGTLSVAPSQAAPVFAEVTVAAAGEGIVGGIVKVRVTFDTGTVTNLAVTGVGSVLGTTQDTATVIGTPTTGTWSINEPTGASGPAGTQTITLTSAVAGTTTITATPTNATTGAPGTAVTKTIKWVAATTVGTYDHSTAIINGGSASSRIYTDTTTAVLTIASTLDATADAVINVTQFNSADTTTVTNLPDAGTKAVTVTITGAGAVGTSAANAGPSVTIAAGSAATQYVFVYADGRNGAATITVSVNSVVIATKTVSFFGAVAAYAASTTTGETLSKNYVGATETATVTIKGLDALKTVMASGTVYATSETTTIATVSVASPVITITGVAVGKTNITVHNASTLAASTITLKIAIEVTEKTAKSYALAFDATSYAPGALVTWTLTAKTATGRPIANGTRDVIGTSTANMTAPTGHPTGALAFVDGVATGTFFAPATAGDFTITTVEGAAIDAVIAGGTAVKTANTISIVNASADAATDAANEATDAANAATDAALAAADAADAATAAAEDASAAVATLAKSVNTALANLKKQITALTKLVNKLLKK
jgi:hypothetical protein